MKFNEIITIEYRKQMRISLSKGDKNQAKLFERRLKTLLKK